MVESASDDCNDAAELVFNQTEGLTTASNSNHENSSGGCKEDTKSASSRSSFAVELVDDDVLNLSAVGKVGGLWPKHVLACITRFLSPHDIVELRIMSTSTRWRAIVTEMLPNLW